MGAIKKKWQKLYRRWVPRSVRERIIKKVAYHGISTHKNHIEVHIFLKNFMKAGLKQRLSVTLSNAEATYALDYDIKGGHMKIEVPYAVIDKMEGQSEIKLMLGQKKMTIHPAEDLDKTKQHFFSNGRYFTLMARRTLKMTHLLPEYRFKGDAPVRADWLYTGYETLALSFTAKQDLQECALAFLYHNKLKVLDNASKDASVLRVEDFSALVTGEPEVYLLEGFELFPITYDGGGALMHTMNHQIAFEDGLLSSVVRSHQVKVTHFDATLEPGHVRMRFALDAEVEPEALIMMDTSSGEMERFPNASQEGARSIFNVPLSALLQTMARKRFVLETGGKAPLRLQPDITGLEAFGFNARLWTKHHHERFKIWFYKRRDGLLGFKIMRRRLRRLVTEIGEFSLSGQIGGDDVFIDSRRYMTFTDRHSGKSTRIEIDQDFTVDLKAVDFLSLKSKGKTIIDIFIEIIHEDGEVLRREKIKYQNADYKKDNFYGRHEVVDDAGNTHHHLITTTPYDNLKIETFMVPACVDIPNDTHQKDMNIWLLGERYDTAQDNGYAMFQWLKDHTDIDAYYVIEETSGDYEKVKDERNILVFGSKAHYEIAFRAGVLLGTHDLENLLPYKTARGFFHYEETIKVFLQHGVLGRKPVEYDKKYYDLPFDLFIVSSTPEKRDVVMKKMGYLEDEVAVTGLARFDHLPHDNETKDILLMPTWRDWISTDEAFLKSKYYAHYTSLIENERLNRVLEENGVHLNFYPHYRAQRYFNDEALDQGRNIHFIRLGEEKVQDLLISHSLLITDYSSVSFDFTLMGKPVVYYHFDAARFFKYGKLRSIGQTFIGDIAKREEDLVDFIESYIHTHFKPKPFDLSGILEYQDHNNQARIYEAVMAKINKRRH